MDIERALVLHNIDYKDNSKILYLYTVNGHKSVIAHGVKKLQNINRFLSQNGTEIKCTISDGTFPSLKDGELVNEFSKIKQDIVSYSYLNHILELVRNTISDDLDHPKMYQFLIKLFHLMDQDKDAEVLTFLFELKLLFFLGHGLHMQTCSVCGENEDLVFHISSGGLICKKHLEIQDQTYGSDVYTLIHNLYYMDIERHEVPEMDGNTRIIIRHIIDLLYIEFVGFSTKSREIIKQIKKY